jgi:hypothetical protein
MGKNLQEFFRARTQRAARTKINGETQKQEWLAAIDQLYAQIRDMLADTISDGTVRMHTRPKTIVELNLGEYSADELILQAGDEEVTFSPKGRNVVGAMGRVDVRGEVGEETLVLKPDRWAFVKSKYPQLRVVPFDAEALERVLRNVMRQ